MEWENISRGKVEVEGQDATGLITAVAKLSAVPPDGWSQYFDSPSGVSFTLTMIRPALRGGYVRMQVSRPEELSSSVEYVDGAIAYANQQYRQQILPRLERQERQRQEETRQREADLQRAREIAEGL